MAHETVVRRGEPLSKLRLHELLMAGWARCVARFGQGGFADGLGVTGAGLRKQLGGSMPDADLIFNSLTICPAALDDILGEYGLRLVTKEAVCTTDDAELLLSRLLAKVIEARQPDSPGGRAIVYSELLPIEQLVRDLHRNLGAFIETIDDARRPRAVA